MISLVKNQIEDVTVELTVEETIGSRLGGYPNILIGDVNIESCMVAEVDTLAVIKAIATSETAFDFEWKIRDCWNAESIVATLKATIELNREIPIGVIVEDTIANKHWINIIRKYDDIYCDCDNYDPQTRTKAMAKIYDCRSHLTYVPMPDELKEVLYDDLGGYLVDE